MTRGRGYAPAARRRGRVVLLVVALVVTLGGCTAARNTLGTNSSPCFDALAVAETAVHHHGSFAGVRLISLASFGRAVHLGADILADAGPGVHDVCAVSYRGTFTVGKVARPLGPPPKGGVGHYAVVVVAKPQNRLVGTVVRLKEPLRFEHAV